MKKLLIATTTLSLTPQLFARGGNGKTNFEIALDIFSLIPLGILCLIIALFLLCIVSCMEAETNADHRREEAEKKKKRDDSL